MMRNSPTGNPVNLLEPNLLNMRTDDHPLHLIWQDQVF